MPVRVDFQNLTRRFRQLDRLVGEPDPLLFALAERLFAHLESNTPVGASANLKEAMLRLRGPYDVPGGRAIGIGDMSMLIDPAISAPPHTIKSFLIWYGKQYAAEKRQRRRAARRLEYERRKLARKFEARKISERIHRINVRLFRLYRRMMKASLAGEKVDEIWAQIEKLRRSRGY